MGTYIVPANSKQSRLIFGLFVPLDLIVLGVGLGLSVIAWVIISASNNSSILALLIGAIPLFLALGSVLIIPNYHNVRQFLTNIVTFYLGRRKYYWKGWCISDEE